MTSTSSADSSAVVASPPIENVPATLDTKGRVRASKEQRRVILAEFERSGVSAAQFARLTGLKYSTLAGWLHRYRRVKSPGRPRKVRLLEAVMEAAGPSVGLVVHLPGGARLEISNANHAVLAAALVGALARPC